MSIDNLPSGATMTRVGISGWVGWGLLTITMVVSTFAASLQRRVGVCASEGLDNPRMWVFRLMPLGQTCAGEATVTETLLQNVLTLVAILAAIAGVSAVLVLLVRRLSTVLPPVDRWLLRGVAAGITLAVIAWISRAASDIPYFPLEGVSLGLTLVISVTFGAGLLGTALAGIVVAAVARAQS